MACKFGRLIEDADERKDRELLIEWAETGCDLRGRPTPATRLHAALRAAGVKIGCTTLKDHRRGSCACEG